MGRRCADRLLDVARGGPELIGRGICRHDRIRSPRCDQAGGWGWRAASLVMPVRHPRPGHRAYLFPQCRGRRCSAAVGAAVGEVAGAETDLTHVQRGDVLGEQSPGLIESGDLGQGAA